MPGIPDEDVDVIVRGLYASERLRTLSKMQDPEERRQDYELVAAAFRRIHTLNRHTVKPEKQCPTKTK